MHRKSNGGLPSNVFDVDFLEVDILEVKLNLSTTNTLGTKKIVAVVDKWSLFRGYFCYIRSNWDLKIVVVADRWSLFGGGR